MVSLFFKSYDMYCLLFSEGAQGHMVWNSSDGMEHVWAGPLSGGSVAVILMNMHDTGDATITADFKTIGLQASQANARDLWLHKDIGVLSGKVSGSVPSHGVLMYKLTPKSVRH